MRIAITAKCPLCQTENRIAHHWSTVPEWELQRFGLGLVCRVCRKFSAVKKFHLEVE
jgi:hypothetical protein